MKVETLRLFDQDVDELIDVFLPVLLAWTRKTLVPEIFEVFGAEKIMKFLDVFAGVRVDVPTRDVLLRALRDAEIYHALATERDTLAGLARKFGIDEWTVQEVQGRVATLLDGVRLHGDG